jgi:Carboxypeptidase regulatory-like domain
MRTVWALFIMAVIVLSVGGCVASPSPSATPTVTPVPVKIISIRGIVLDQNGTPVPEARVALWQGDQLVETPENVQYANATGYFSFTNLQPAHYQITADIRGLQGLVDQRFNESASIEVVIPGYTAVNVTATASTTPAGMPHFDVVRTGPTTVQVRLTSFGGVTSLRGFYVKSPFITTPEIVPVDRSLGESFTADITDPNLKAPAHFVASSWVNGNYAIVVDATI